MTPKTIFNDARNAESGGPRHEAAVAAHLSSRPPCTGSPCARRLTTDEVAALLGMSAQSLRKRYSQTGSYFNVRPVKLPNRRLLWPADAVEQLINR